jgi:hypothetical protein
MLLMGGVGPLAHVFQPELEGLLTRILGSGKQVLMIICIPMICMLPDFTYMFIKQVYFPNPCDLLLK